MDGIRVIVWERELYTRTGVKLSAGKGAAALREMVRGLDCSLDGEWLMSQGLYYLFDLPDQAGDYDQRRLAMAELVAAHPSVRLLPSFTANFPSVYETLRGQAEGVVLKRRRSLYGRMPRASHGVTRLAQAAFLLGHGGRSAVTSTDGSVQKTNLLHAALPAPTH